MGRGNIRLLVVEDNDAFRDLIRHAFETRSGSYKWELTEAVDGETALDLVLGDGKDSMPLNPDIILLDWNLPKISGSEVLRRLKEHQELRKIPILIFSSSEADRDIHEAYAHHANGYLTKPSTVEALHNLAAAIEIFWIASAKLASPRTHSAVRMART